MINFSNAAGAMLCFANDDSSLIIKIIADRVKVSLGPRDQEVELADFPLASDRWDGVMTAIRDKVRLTNGQMDAVYYFLASDFHY